MDDALCTHHNVDVVLQEFHQSFALKLGFVKQDMYLCVNLCKNRSHIGGLAWAMSPVKYVHEALRNGKARLVINQ